MHVISIVSGVPDNQEAGEFFNPSLAEVEEGRYGLGKIDLLVLRLAQSLLLSWYRPVVCLLGTWNTFSV